MLHFTSQFLRILLGNNRLIKICNEFYDDINSLDEPVLWLCWCLVSYGDQDFFMDQADITQHNMGRMLKSLKTRKRRETMGLRSPSQNKETGMKVNDSHPNYL